MKSFVNILLFVCLCNFAFAQNKEYHFDNTFTIKVSDKMELKNPDDLYSHYTGSSNNGTIIFQQKGLSKMSQSAFQTYCRIMMKCFDDPNGELPSVGDDWTDYFDSSDLYDFEQAAYDELAPPQKMVSKPEASFVKTQNFQCIQVRYVRTGDKGNVTVKIYYFFNRYKAVKLITSYRISDGYIWADVVDEAFKSFKWDKIY